MKMKLLLLIAIIFFSQTYIWANVYDVAAVRFTEPSTPKADTGRFSDAVYHMVGETGKIGILLKNKGSLNVTGNKARISIFVENEAGIFKNMVFDTTIKVDIQSGDSSEIEIPIFSYENSFNPKVYDEFGKEFPAGKIPLHFSTMLRNVTPRYKVVATLQKDQDTTNNTFSGIFRFYVQRSQIVLSVENSFADITNETNPDIIAGRLNSDSLRAGLTNLGINSDLFDRIGWDEKCVDYSSYFSIFWSDGLDKPLGKREKAEITRFLRTGFPDSKKNLIICSQEVLRENFYIDSIWVKVSLGARLYPFYPTDPNNGKVYSTEENPDNYLIGESIARAGKFSIIRTSFKNDSGPVPGIASLYKDGQGLARKSLSYKNIYNKDSLTVDISAGTTFISLYSNSIYIAVDWRHFSNNEWLQSGIINFIGADLDGRKPLIVTVKSENSMKYPGDSVIYSVYTADPILLGWPISVSLKVENKLTGELNTISTNSNGYGKYNVFIPLDAKAGDYDILFKEDKHYSFKPFKNVLTVLSDSANVSGNFEVCQNDIVSYFASGPDRSYSWQTDLGEIIGNSKDTIVKIQWKVPGEAKLIVNQTIIPSKKTKEYIYSVNVRSAPPKPEIIKSNDTLYSSSETGNAWYCDGKEITGENRNYIAPKNTGNYTVRVTGENGCTSLPSDPKVFITGVSDESKIEDISVVYNQAADRIVLKYNNISPGYVTLKLYNCLGNEAATLVNDYREAGWQIIELPQDLYSGAYYYLLSKDNILFSGKLIITQ